ncbi:MAG: hypothetical protein ACI3U8_06730 [Candidatus Onthomonas sp.]
MGEIGGYLELEQFAGREYYTGVRRLNLGRTAIQYALKALGARELWVPRFLCDSMLEACEKTDCRLHMYQIGDDLQPRLEEWQARPDCWLLLVNYYGQYSQEQILDWQARYGRIIVDNTQAFFQPPVEGVPTLYSIRKFFGLPDGAYLYLPEQVDDRALYEALDRDSSRTRMGHLLGRYEASAGAFYQEMLANAHTFYDEPVKTMSRLTENLLRAIPYEQVKARREENWKRLHQLLGAQNPLNWPMPEGPFVYPFYHPRAAALKKELAAQKIFVPTYWNNVIRDEPEDSPEHRLAANLLPLPCDQRYGGAEMETLAQAVQALL